MECANGALGLNEELNEDLTFKGESNRIDNHMMRNTEYGAIAILSASGYGNPSNDMYIESSTGNNSGFMFCFNTRIAGCASNYISNINNKYYDMYSDDSVKIGDAMDIAYWHGNAAGSFGWVGEWNHSFKRYWNRGMWDGWNHHASVFSYQADNSDAYSYGVAVCGEGL